MQVLVVTQHAVCVPSHSLSLHAGDFLVVLFHLESNQQI